MCKGSNSSSSNNGILEFGMCARGGGCSIGGQYHTSIGKARDIELLSVRSRKASDPQKKASWSRAHERVLNSIHMGQIWTLIDERASGSYTALLGG